MPIAPALGTPLSPHQQVIWEAAQTAACVKEVARKVGAHPKTVGDTLWRCCKKLGVPPYQMWGKRLTPSERDVVALIAGGASMVEVGERLGMSLSTVGSTLYTARRRMGVTAEPGPGHQKRLLAATIAAWRAQCSGTR